MKKADSIKLLNKGVADELQAVHQYMYFHFHLDDQGFKPLAQLFKRIAIQEMGHLEAFAERILFLKGDAEMVPSGAVEKIVEPEAALQKAMDMEQDSVKAYNQAALACSANSDSASKQIFERLVNDEEGHFDLFEKQHDNIKRFGLSYLALQSFGTEASESKVSADD
jgi:bacterioferritin